MHTIGSWYINKLQRKRIHSGLYKYLVEHKPDLIISVVPLINSSILDVAQELSIPFLLVPTDLDISGYLIDIQNPTFNNFFVAVSCDEPSVREPLTVANIVQDNIIYAGFLARQDFFQSKNIMAIKADYTIPVDKPIVMIIMGSRSNNELLLFVQELIKSTIALHMLILVGTCEIEKEKIQKMQFPDHVSSSIISYTPHISDLMAISDLLITKTGPNTVFEAIYMDVPCLLDVTCPVLPWEQCVITFVEKYQYGDVIATHNQVAFKVESLIQGSEAYAL